MNYEYCVIHNIGDLKHPNYTSLDKVLKQDSICFDDCYYNVYEHREAWKGKNVILFVIGDYMGKDNSWNIGKCLN